MLTPPRLSKLKSNINIRAMQTTLYNNLQEEVLDNGFLVNEIILNSDARHIEKTIINFTILSIFIYGFFYFKQRASQEKKIENLQTYRIIKSNIKGFIVFFGILLFKNVDHAL